jgi:chromosome partitioning protein
MPVVVAFLSQKGGVGKSTLARVLADLATKSGVKVLVADLDRQQSTVMRWHQHRVTSKLEPPIDVVAFDSVDEAIERGETYDLVIIDAPGHASRETLDIARHSHLIVQPTGPGLDDLHPGVLLFHELFAEGIPVSRMNFALCRTSAKDEEVAARRYLAKADYSVLPGSIPERSEYRAAQNSGYAITETDDASLNMRAEELMVAMLERLKNEIESLRRQVTRENLIGKESA